MEDDHDNKIMAISYFYIEQVIEFNGKVEKKTEHQIILYKDTVITASHQFKLENVLDISYKLFSNNDSLLYLHTNQGVFTYKVSTDPKDFKNEFKKIKGVY